ncbi:MAG: deoxyribonuclease V [Vicinamibacteria bacterium]|jgi:deoxyribonuclease V|nr:deoxyribonuclease V [Vicinamibacteria bacterium]
MTARAAGLRPVIPARFPIRRDEAIAVQEALRARLRLTPCAARVDLIAGADVSYSESLQCTYAAIVVMSLPALRTVEIATARATTRVPYMPGLLAFRELPALLKAFRRLKSEPQVLLFDAQGTAHPRRIGLACHAGVLLDRPAIGCAKSLLVGRHADPARERGSWSELLHKGEVVGAVLRTRDGVRPVYVSPGHLVDLPSSIRIVLSATRKLRLPEPLRLAHLHVTRVRVAAEANCR